MPKLDEQIRQGNILKATTARFVDTFFASAEMDGFDNIPVNMLEDCYKILYTGAMKLLVILNRRGIDTKKLINGNFLSP